MGNQQSMDQTECITRYGLTTSSELRTCQVEVDSLKRKNASLIEEYDKVEKDLREEQQKREKIDEKLAALLTENTTLKKQNRELTVQVDGLYEKNTWQYDQLTEWENMAANWRILAEKCWEEKKQYQEKRNELTKASSALQP
jgi:uncharacterized coiled-coil DUF342 family protein